MGRTPWSARVPPDPLHLRLCTIAAHNTINATTAVKKTIRATPINITPSQAVFLYLLTLALPAVLPAQDPIEILRRATDLDTRNTEISRSYTFLERQEQRDLDSGGKLKKTESSTFDVTLLEGSPYRRLVARNDKPLSPRTSARKKRSSRRASPTAAARPRNSAGSASPSGSARSRGSANRSRNCPTPLPSN